MRRIVIAFMSTLSGLVLLFSYHTSTNSTSTIALGSPTPVGTPKATTPSPTATTTGPSPTTAPTTTAPTTAAPTTAAPTTAAPTTAAPTTTAPTTAAPAAVSGTFTGDSVSTRWGDVQVAITVSDGKITQAQAVNYPQNNGRDQEINAYALPVLAREVTQAQSAQIDAVSGATVTSDGYIQSLQSALDQAHL